MATPTELCTAFAHAVRRAVPHDRFVISCAEAGDAGDRLTPLFYSDGSGASSAALSSLAAAVLKSRRPIMRAPHARNGAGPGVCRMGVPLLAGGDLVGVAVFEARRTASYSAAQRRAALDTGAVLAGALARAIATEALRRLERERVTLSEINRVISSAVDLDDVYEHFAEELQKLLQFDRIAILSVDHASGTFTVTYVSGIHIPGLEPGETFTLQGSPAETVITSRAGMLLSDEDPERLVSQYPRLAYVVAAGIHSVIAVPLMSRNEVIGILRISSKAPNAYTPKDLDLAERVGALIASTVANAELYRQAMHLAEERELRARLDAENRELLRIDQVKRRFFSLVSHELKTPLTTMVAFADVLAANRDGNLTPRQLNHLQVMQRNGRRLNLLVEDLFDLARIETGGFKLNRREFEARKILEEQVASFAPIVERKEQQIVAEIPERDIWIEADADRLVQIVSNLLSNASKYSPNGSKIELRASVDGERLTVTVRDHGIGIQKKHHRDIFTAFFRADNEETRAAPGTGLGLFITKTLVELHGGQIEVDSEPGQGTTMSFYVRGVLAAAPSGPQTAAPAQLRPRLEFLDAASTK
ncbi:MAG: GAF domain-containing protein [Chloroflexi bacterium]|nr:GAF domain-containing protein [Chloroflexota bacterium]